MGNGGTPRFRGRARERRGSTADAIRPEAQPPVAAMVDALAGPDRGARARALEYVFRNGDGPKPELTAAEDETVARVILRATDRGPLDPAELIGVVGRCRGSLRQQAVLHCLRDSIAQRPLGAADLAFLLTTVAAMESPPAGEEVEPFSRLAAAIGRDTLIPVMDEPGPVRLGAIRLLAGP